MNIQRTKNYLVRCSTAKTTNIVRDTAKIIRVTRPNPTTTTTAMANAASSNQVRQVTFSQMRQPSKLYHWLLAPKTAYTTNVIRDTVKIVRVTSTTMFTTRTSMIPKQQTLHQHAVRQFWSTKMNQIAAKPMWRPTSSSSSPPWKQRHCSQPQQPQPTTTVNVMRDTEKIVRVARRGNTTHSSGNNSSSSSSSSPPPPTSTTKMSMWQRFLEPKEMPPRYTFAWYREMVLICTVFGVTGTSTMMVVRPAVKDVLGIDGSFRDGPWSYRLCSIFLISPIYATLLVAVGTVFGRHAYFRHFSVKIFSRFGIPPELLDKNWKIHQQNFRKW